MYPVILLMATCPRIETILNVSLPSVVSQLLMPDAVVIVADKREFTDAELKELQVRLPNSKIYFLHNQGQSGVADTWNTGLSFIQKVWNNAYVAILDDDDCWDENHLSTCATTLEENGWPDIVISGLKIRSDNRDIDRPLIKSLTINDFLIGNPGWQGSNTFAKVSTLMKAGGFTSGLHSCNDRDLAIRLLQLENILIVFTNCFTATWNLHLCTDSLSQPSLEKKKALDRFLNMYRHLMNEEQMQAFLERSHKLFGFGVSDLT